MTSNDWDGVERPERTRDEIHQEHHEFIRALIAKEERKQQIWNKIQENVGSWALIAILGFMALVAWDSIVHYVRGTP